MKEIEERRSDISPSEEREKIQIARAGEYKSIEAKSRSSREETVR